MTRSAEECEVLTFEIDMQCNVPRKFNNFKISVTILFKEKSNLIIKITYFGIG